MLHYIWPDELKTKFFLFWFLQFFWFNMQIRLLTQTAVPESSNTFTFTHTLKWTSRFSAPNSSAVTTHSVRVDGLLNLAWKWGYEGLGSQNSTFTAVFNQLKVLVVEDQQPRFHSCQKSHMLWRWGLLLGAVHTEHVCAFKNLRRRKWMIKPQGLETQGELLLPWALWF